MRFPVLVRERCSSLCISDVLRFIHFLTDSMKSRALNFSYVLVKKKHLLSVMTLLADFTERSTELRYTNFPLNSKFTASVSHYTSGFTHSLSHRLHYINPLTSINSFLYACVRERVFERERFTTAPWVSKKDLGNVYFRETLRKAVTGWIWMIIQHFYNPPYYENR